MKKPVDFNEALAIIARTPKAVVLEKASSSTSDKSTTTKVKVRDSATSVAKDKSK